MTSRALLSICAGLLTAAPASAHHNAAAHYQLDGVIEVSGVVTEFRLVNPHLAALSRGHEQQRGRREMDG